MEFIRIAYCVTVPILLLLFFLPAIGKHSRNVLAVTNLLMVMHSVYLAKQLVGIYQFVKKIGVTYEPGVAGGSWPMVRYFAVILLPLLLLHPYFRRNFLFSLVLLAVTYSVFPIATWNPYDLAFKIPAYLCLLCSAYALLWLTNQLPYQAKPV